MGRFKQFVLITKGKVMTSSWEEVDRHVRLIYPGAHCHGSAGSWHWEIDGRIVAEAIAQDRGELWQYRIAQFGETVRPSSPESEETRDE